MTVTEAWRELHRSRFADLPLDCGNLRDPGIIYSEDLRDWSDKATTPDQTRMEHYIDRYDLRHARVLHVGIGNSGFAKRFHARVKEIVGTTIDEPEVRVARSLGLPNYRFVIHNKYSGRNDGVEGKFDFILDNNPTSPCCCFSHLAELFDFYRNTLAADGQIVTDRVGLSWVPVDTSPRWSFDFEDLAAVGAAAGLTAFQVSNDVYVLARSAPRRPALVSRSRHICRRIAALPRRTVKSGPGGLVRIARKSIKRVLVSIAPWALPARYRSSSDQ